MAQTLIIDVLYLLVLEDLQSAHNHHSSPLYSPSPGYVYRVALLLPAATILSTNALTVFASAKPYKHIES